MEFLLFLEEIPQEFNEMFLRPLKIPARNTEFLLMMQERVFLRNGRK